MARKPTLDPNQLPLIVPESSWRPPTELPNLLNEKVIALDTETNDPQLTELGPSWFRGGGHLAGISLAWRGGNIYIPVGHKGGDNLDKAQVLAWLKPLLANFTGTLVLMHALYDLGWLRTEGIPIPPQANLWDVMMVEALLDEHRGFYNLAAIAQSYHLKPKDETLLREAAAAYGLDPKKDLWQLPGRFVGAYAERDADAPLEIYERQKVLVAQQGLEKVVRLEHDLIPLLQEMRFRGVRVDMKNAEILMDQFTLEHEGYRSEIKRLTGYNVDVWSGDSCAAAMDRADLVFKRTPTGKPAFTDDWLAGHEHEVPRLISKARKSYKAGQTFCKNMVLDHADKNGRIHAAFHPLRSDDGGTVSGRFSSSDPNLQQVPARDARMNTLIRGLFLPEEGEQWCAIDYAGQEPRLTVHYAAARGCTKAQEAVDKYNTDPNTDYHNLVAEMMFGSGYGPAERKKAKTINLGLAYGMGGAKLARSLRLPTVWKMNSYSGREYEAAGPEAQDLLDKYHVSVPFIRELSKEYSMIAETTGQIRTLSGRLCRFPYWEPKKGGRAMIKKDAISTYGHDNIKRSYTYAALNRKIQGSAADMVKVSLRDLWREGLVPLVTVHDENGLSVPDKTVARRAAEIMSSCVMLKVPLKVDIDFGPSWGAAKPMVEDEDLA